MINLKSETSSFKISFYLHSVQKVLSSSGRATRRWPMYFPIRRSLPARPEPGNTFWTASTGTEESGPRLLELVARKPCIHLKKIKNLKALLGRLGLLCTIPIIKRRLIDLFLSLRLLFKSLPSPSISSCIFTVFLSFSFPVGLFFREEGVRCPV